MAAPVPCHQCHNCCHVATRTATTNSDTSRVAINGAGILGRPPGGSIAVLHSGRKLVLWCKPVIYRHQYATGLACYCSTKGIFCLEVAHPKAAPMEVDQHRKRPSAFRCVNAYGYLATGTGYQPVLNLG